MSNNQNINCDELFTMYKKSWLGYMRCWNKTYVPDDIISPGSSRRINESMTCYLNFTFHIKGYNCIDYKGSTSEDYSLRHKLKICPPTTWEES